jgi:hypothetical protein
MPFDARAALRLVPNDEDELVRTFADGQPLPSGMTAEEKFRPFMTGDQVPFDRWLERLLDRAEGFGSTRAHAIRVLRSEARAWVRRHEPRLVDRFEQMLNDSDIDPITAERNPERTRFRLQIRECVQGSDGPTAA